jgi:hypothetical protein
MHLVNRSERVEDRRKVGELGDASRQHHLRG